jgi:hypothetical protein
MIHHHAAAGHHLLDVAEAQRIGHIPTHAGEHPANGKCNRLITLRRASFMVVTASSVGNPI